MADLYNLLGEIDEELQQHEDQEEVTHHQQQLQGDGELLDEEEGGSSSSPTRGGRWEDGEGREVLDLPPALDEAAQHRTKLRQGRTGDSENDRDDYNNEERLDLEDFAVPSTATKGAAELGEEALLSGEAFSKLQYWWVQEQNSPEILPFDNESLRLVLRALHRQEDTMDGISSGEGSHATGNANIDALLTSILKIDADRVKFVVADLLKIRLHKIEAHPLHMRELIDRLSEHETDYLKEYGMLFEQHLNTTVLDHFPQDAWKQLDAPEMIDKPNLERYVFVRVKDPRGVSVGNGVDEDNPNYQHYDRGTYLIVRYSNIRQLFFDGRLELLM